MSKLRIASDLSLPLEFVTESTGILAVKRAGKSHTAKRLTEQLHKAGQQVVVVDPKGDWWGLRSSADGKGPGLPLPILGGEHGDIPLEPGAGDLVAKLVVEQRVSLVLDLSDFRKHQVTTFMTAFLETLYRLKAKDQYRTPMMLVIDEADAIAPQQPRDEQARMLGAAEDIVRRGGQRGIGIILVSQRAAVLNKNVLTQVGILILLRTTGKQDIEAVKEWIKYHGQPTEAEQVLATIAAMPRGTAWVWAPGWPDEHGIFRQIKVGPVETFDSGATPKPGHKLAPPKTVAEVDLDAFRREMASAIERAKAEDPKLLRAELAATRKELSKALARPAPAPAKTGKTAPAHHPQDLKLIAALRQGLEDLMKVSIQINAQDFIAKAGEAVDPEALQKAITDAANQAVKLVDRALDGRRAQLDQLRRESQRVVSRLKKLVEVDAEDLKVEVNVRHNEPYTVTPRPRPPVRVTNPDVPPLRGDALPGAKQRILDALAWLEAVGISEAEKVQLALLADTSPTSSAYANNLGALRSSGLIDYPANGRVALTNEGRSQANHSDQPLTVDDLHEALRWKLAPAKWRILEALIGAYPDSLPKDELAEKANASPTSSAFANNLGSLRSLGLIDYPEQGQVAAEPVVFLDERSRR